MIMTLIYPNIVPENNLRLPDALTVKHGPARLLSRFVHRRGLGYGQTDGWRALAD
jgi:hypothetical protein